METNSPDCKNCDYRKTLARMVDAHVWAEDCPCYKTEVCNGNGGADNG